LAVKWIEVTIAPDERVETLVRRLEAASLAAREHPADHVPAVHVDNHGRFGVSNGARLLRCVEEPRIVIDC